MTGILNDPNQLVPFTFLKQNLIEKGGEIPFRFYRYDSFIILFVLTKFNVYSDYSNDLYFLKIANLK